MSTPANVHGRRRGRGLRPWLILLKHLGLTGFLGGLGALVALGILAPTPDDLAGWTVLRGAVRAIFYPCVFAGLFVTIGAGIALFLGHPRVFLGMRWFRIKAVVLVVAVPGLHVVARGSVLAFDAALGEGRLGDLGAHWDRMTTAFVVALAVMLPLAALARFKPRLRRR